MIIVVYESVKMRDKGQKMCLASYFENKPLSFGRLCGQFLRALVSGWITFLS